MAALAPTFAALKGFAGKIFTAATGSVGGALSAGGTLLSTAGAIQAAKSQSEMANYQAALADKRAKEERGLATKRSAEFRRRGRILASRARAVGAASGGGVDYEGIADIEAESELRAMNAIWEGDARATDLELQGREARTRGKARRRAGYTQAGATLLGGGTNLMDKYG